MVFRFGLRGAENILPGHPFALQMQQPKSTPVFHFHVSRAHLDTATGAPASGPAPLHEPEPETPGRRPALHRPISPLVAVARYASVKKRSLTRLVCIASCLVVGMSLSERLFAQTTNTATLTPDIFIAGIEGKVEVLRVGAQTWDPAYTNQVLHAGDRVRVPERGRVTLLLSDQSVERFGELKIGRA